MLDVYIAKSIVTMNRSLPEATAIAIRDGMVIEVGSLESLQPWLIREDHVIHRDFESSVMVPGFIDPHLHPAMAAVILPMHFITAMPWSLPWRDVPATTRPRGSMLKWRGSCLRLMTRSPYSGATMTSGMGICTASG